MVVHELGYWLQQFLNACTLASFYVPLAVAFALVQGLTNKIFLSFGDFAMYAAFAAIYAGLASLLAGNNTATILAVSLALAVLSSAALGHFAATHVFAPLIGHTSQAFMIESVCLSIKFLGSGVMRGALSRYDALGNQLPATCTQLLKMLYRAYWEKPLAVVNA